MNCVERFYYLFIKLLHKNKPFFTSRKKDVIISCVTFSCVQSGITKANCIGKKELVNYRLLKPMPVPWSLPR